MSSDPRKGKSIVRGVDAKIRKAAKTEYTLNKAYEIFYNVKKAERMRERTLADYRKHWRYLNEWLAEAYPELSMLHEFTAEVARDYVTYMSTKRTKYAGIENREVKGRNLAAGTVLIRLRSLRAMCNYWTAEGMVELNPAKNLKPPKQDMDEIETFTDEQLTTLLAAPDVNTFAGYRDKTLMLLLADSGLRINEALNLTLEHLDVKSRCIRLPAAMNKNRKPRIVPLSPEVVRELLTLISENQSFFDTDHLFVANYGEPLKADHFRRRLSIHARAAGLDNVKVSPHQFRHYFCKTYLLNGGDIFSLQRIVAHAEISTTRKYVQMSDDNIRQQHSQFSPIQRLGKKSVRKRK